MLLREFYEKILPKYGRYVLFQNKRHSFFDTLDQLVDATVKRIDTQGLYFGTAAFGSEDRRTQDNVRALRAHRIDIDAGKEKYAKDPEGTYPSQSDAIAALVAAVKDGFIKPSLIVSSGEGLHVYWVMENEVQKSEWKRTALMLNAAGKAKGLKIDVVCTADEARVLRPVDTLHKNGTRVAVLKDTGAVYDHDTFSKIVQALVPVDMMPVDRTVKVRDLNDDILGGVKSPPSSLVRVAEHCSAVALMRDTLGNVPEPLWRAVIGIAKYCDVDGEDVVHAWSSGHPKYDEFDTQHKLDRWDTPPTTCAYMATLHAGCATCQYRGKITTPKQVGYVNLGADEGVKPVASDNPTAQAAGSGADASVDRRGGDAGDEGAAEFSGMALPDDEAPVHAVAVAGTPTPAIPVPDRPDLFDKDQPFFYVQKSDRWTLYHTFKIQTTDPTGQKVYTQVTKPVIHKLIWADSSSDVGASEADGVLITFGRVARAGGVQIDRFSMAAGLASEVGALMKFMLDQGVNIEPTNADAGKHLRFYILNEIIKRQNDMRFVIKGRFGYHTHEDQMVCCLGAHTVYADGTIMRTIHSSDLSAIADALVPNCLPKRAKPIWTESDWPSIEADAMRYANFIRTHYSYDGYDKARLAMAIALSSPMLAFAADDPFVDANTLPKAGFVVSMYSSSSGVGKTALEDLVCIAFGRTNMRLSGKKELLTDTASYTTAQNLGIYPLILDEVTQNDAKTTANLVESFANGQGRVRSDQTGALQKTQKTWSLVTLLSTNIPQREMLASAQKNSEALQMRMLELDFSDLPMVGNKEQFREEFRDISLASGAFGLVQARLIAHAGPKRMARFVEMNLKEAAQLLNVPQSYRYFVRALAIVLANIKIMGKFSPFDKDDIVATFQNAVRTMQGFITENKKTPEDVLAQLIQAASPNMAITNTFTKLTTNRQGDVLLNPNVHDPLVAREVKEWNAVMIDRAFIAKWCTDNKISMVGLLSDLRTKNLIIDERRRRLGTGLIGKSNVNVYCFTIRIGAVAAEGGATDNVTPLHQERSRVVEVPEAAAY